MKHQHVLGEISTRLGHNIGESSAEFRWFMDDGGRLGRAVVLPIESRCIGVVCTLLWDTECGLWGMLGVWFGAEGVWR